MGTVKRGPRGQRGQREELVAGGVEGAGVAQAECTPQGSLGQCYTVTPEVCATAFLTAMRECTNNLRPELPAMVDMSNVDATSQTLGLCAVEAYHLGLTQAGLRQQTPECQPTQ